MRQVLLIALLASNLVLPAFADPYSNQGVPKTYMESSFSPTAAQSNNRFGLPNTILSPYTGSPGDALSQGRPKGGGSASGTAAVPSVGLPACSMGAAVRTPGDRMRSDMGRQINGQAMQPRTVYRPQMQYQQAPRQTQYAQVFTYSSYPKTGQQ
jgi:hypothetical protein